MEFVAKRGGPRDAAPEAPLRPTLYIALGGTGLKVLARLRGRIRDRYGDPDGLPGLSFLGVDCSQDDLARGGVDGGQGYPLQPRDLLDTSMSSSEVQEILEGLHGPFQSVGAWLGSQDLGWAQAAGIQKGAGRCRPLGRLALLRAVEAFRRAVVERKHRLLSWQRASVRRGAISYDRPEPLDVVLVASLAGGMGSGAVLDCAYHVRSVHEEYPGGEIRGMLLLPDCFRHLDARGREAVRANGYAALLELEHFSDPARHPFPFEGLKPGTPKIRPRARPFDVCYLFSSSDHSGHRRLSIDETLDVVSEALDLTSLGSQIGGRMRGTWANARQLTYEGRLEYVEHARTEAEGGAGTDEAGLGDGKRFEVYRKTWSACYSALGISRLTLNRTETRKLAAIRILRRLLEWELGPEDPDSEALRAQAEASLDRARAEAAPPSSFLDRFRRRVDVLVEDATAAEQADRAARESLGRARRLRLRLEGSERADGGLERSAEALVARARRAGEDIMGAMRDPNGSLSTTRDLRRFLLSLVRDRIRELEVGRQPAPRDPGEFEAIEQWRDLEANGVRDEWGLGARALRIVRERLRRDLKARVDVELASSGWRIEKMFLENLSDLLSGEEEADDRRAAALSRWVEQLDAMRESTVGSVEAKTLSISLGSVRDRWGAAIDEEIQRCLGGGSRPWTDPPQLSRLRARLLDQLGEDILGSEGPETLGMAALSLQPRYSALLGHLLEICAREILPDCPAEADVFVGLASAEGLPTGLAVETQARSRPRWPLASVSREEEIVHQFRFASAAASREFAELQRQVRRRLEGEDVTWWEARPGELDGELVFVSESHGLPLQSLANLREYRASYEDTERSGHLRSLHIDTRLAGTFEDLIPPSAEGVWFAVRRGDLALLGVLLGMFTWQTDRWTFDFDMEEPETDLGPGLAVISERLNIVHRRMEIEREIGEWFTSRSQDDGGPAEAEEKLDELIVLDLCLELLGGHVFPSKPESDAPPEHTRLRRIREVWLRPALATHGWDLRNLSGRQHRERCEIATMLHRRTVFVGPAQVTSSPSTERRLLVPLPPERWGASSGEDVLREAGDLWFDEDWTGRVLLDHGEFEESPDMAARLQYVEVPGGRVAIPSQEAYSSDTVVTQYPAPIAVAFQRFCGFRQPGLRLLGLQATATALLRYLLTIGLSDLLDRLSLRGAKDLPGHPAFAFLRKELKPSLGGWIDAVRETGRALAGEDDPFFPEFPAVCGPGGPVPELLGAVAKLRNDVIIHAGGDLVVGDEEPDELIATIRPLLEAALQSVDFIRHYPLAFSVLKPDHFPARQDGPTSRRSFHGCMGCATAGGREPYVADVEVPLRDDQPFVVSRDGKSLLHLWPLLHERLVSQTNRRSLHVFDRIMNPHGRNLTRFRASAIDVRSNWSVVLRKSQAPDFEWLFEELGRNPLRAEIPEASDLPRAVDPDRMGQLAGGRLGKNRLLSLVAHGGFGAVYSATPDGDRVAVKVLEREKLEAQIARFAQEFDELKSAEEHPGIVTCLEWGNDLIDGRDYPWYSMEFASGGDLRRRLGEIRVELAGDSSPWLERPFRDDAIAVFSSVCDAVAHLHGLHIVHRDIKPGNVLIMEGGRFCLSDFGLVKNLRQPTGLTATGAVLGTPAYMAPEQGKGEFVGKPADVYSLGVLLAELATGEKPPGLDGPLGGPREGSTLAGFEPLRRLKDIRRFILRLTDVDPDRRPQDAVEVKQGFLGVLARLED